MTQGCGPLQIIPNRGPHTQFYVDAETLYYLWLTGFVKYNPEYGPGANVYTPTAPADESRVRSWVQS